MKRHFQHGFAPAAFAMIALLAGNLRTSAAPEPPVEWIEPATGHKVVQLSSEPWSSSFYFHQNGYTAEGDKLVISTPEGLSTIDLKTHKVDLVVEGWADQVVVGRKTRQVFYYKNDAMWVTHLDTHVTRQIAKLPAGFRRASGLAVNADETMLAGSLVEGPRTNAPADWENQSPLQRLQRRPTPREKSLETRWAERLPMRLYTVQIKTGEIKTFHPSNDW